MNVQASDTLNRVPFAIEDPRLIPTQRYYDEAFFQLENERMWPHVWQMACRLEEIPNLGDFTQYTILDKSVIIVRTRDGVKAFHNACRHRGVRLADAPGNCAKTGFVCPFHGWRWNMDGRNTFVFGREIFDEDLLDHALIDLPPVRIDFWAGCAFINFDDDVPGLRECLGPVADRMDARHADKLKMDWWYATVLPTNWKLAMEAFQEAYHLMRTHPQLHALTVNMGDYGPDAGGMIPNKNLTSRQAIETSIEFMHSLGTGMGGMVHETELAVIDKLRDMEVPDDVGEALMQFYGRIGEEITKDALARGAPMFDINKVSAEVKLNAVEFMFPHYFLLPFMGAMSSYRVRPLTAETCYFEIWSLAMRPEGEPFDTPRVPVVLPYDSEDFPEVPKQDYANLPRQQLGLHAGGFTHMRLSSKSEGMLSNYQRLIDGYIAGRDAQVLAQGQRIVNSGYEAPILDLGF